MFHIYIHVPVWLVIAIFLFFILLTCVTWGIDRFVAQISQKRSQFWMFWPLLVFPPVISVIYGLCLLALGLAWCLYALPQFIVVELESLLALLG